jgi:hypothetical protein
MTDLLSRYILTILQHLNHASIVVRIYFFRITQYNADAHNTHIHSPLWIHVRKTLSLWAPSKDLPEVTIAPRRRRERCLYHLTHNPINPENPRKRCEHQDLNPGSVPMKRTTIGLQAQSLYGSSLIRKNIAPIFLEKSLLVVPQLLIKSTNGTSSPKPDTGGPSTAETGHGRPLSRF